MIVTHAPTIAHAVISCTREGVRVSPAEFDRYVATGMRFATAPDDLQELVAKCADPFDPGAQCFTHPCGCRTAFVAPYAGRTATPGAYTRRCGREDPEGLVQARTDFLSEYAHAVAINAIVAARRPGTPRGLQHAYFFLAGLPHDEECVTGYFLSRPVPPEGDLTLDELVVLTASLWVVVRRSTCPALSVTDRAPLVPYISPYRYAPAARPGVLADFATYMEIR